jgi:hypothetical protein
MKHARDSPLLFNYSNTVPCPRWCRNDKDPRRWMLHVMHWLLTYCCVICNNQIRLQHVSRFNRFDVDRMGRRRNDTNMNEHEGTLRTLMIVFMLVQETHTILNTTFLIIVFNVPCDWNTYQRGCVIW